MGLKNRMLSLLYPARCVICDEIVDRVGESVCRKCRNKIIYIEEPRCLKCGRQLKREEQEYCRDCRTRNHKYIQGTALYDYGSMADSLFRFKYKGRMEYAGFYGAEMYRRKKDGLSMVRPDALVPVPIHSSRKKKRGYNQAELLARELSKCSGIPLNTGLI